MSNISHNILKAAKVKSHYTQINKNNDRNKESHNIVE